MSSTKARKAASTFDKERDSDRRKFVHLLKVHAGVSWKEDGTETRGEKNLGALAALRRGLGRPAGAAAEMYPYVVPHLPDGATRAEEHAYFLIAALFAWHQVDWTLGEGQKRRDINFGASYRRLFDETTSESIEHRFVALLNAHREDLPEHLRHAVGLLRSKEIPVDWAQLLGDVAAWDDPRRSTQLAWARSYWRAEPPKPAAPKTGARRK